MTNFSISELEANLAVEKLNKLEEEIQKMRVMQRDIENWLDGYDEPIPGFGWVSLADPPDQQP